MQEMNCSYLVLIVVMLTVQSVLAESFRNSVIDCKKNLGYEGDLRNLNYNDPNYPEKAKCVMSCALEQKGVIKEDGSIDKEKEKELGKEMLKNEEILKTFLAAVDECDASVKENKCETGYQFLKCLYNKNRDSRK